ncbi:hypothetical protein MKX01_009085 [Papaver californicum]|nr:hypothetical protein MKX01_009085 [Papaver californicum]
MFNSYRERSYWSLLENPPNGLQIVIVRAENSDRWSPGVVNRLESLASRTGKNLKERFQFIFYRSQGIGFMSTIQKGCFRTRKESEGKVSVHLLPKSGHWVHVDNPKGLLDIVAPNIVSTP